MESPEYSIRDVQIENGKPPSATQVLGGVLFDLPFF